MAGHKVERTQGRPRCRRNAVVKIYQSADQLAKGQGQKQIVLECLTLNNKVRMI